MFVVSFICDERVGSDTFSRKVTTNSTKLLDDFVGASRDLFNRIEGGLFTLVINGRAFRVKNIDNVLGLLSVVEGVCDDRGQANRDD